MTLSQIPGVDYFDTYAPVVKMASIRALLALSTALDFEIHQIDIKNAYLNGKFEEEEVIYMTQPPAVHLTDDCDKVLRLLRPIYGLKQAFSSSLVPSPMGNLTRSPGYA